MVGETYVLLRIIWYLPADAVDGLHDAAKAGAAAAQLMLMMAKLKINFW
jgi:hypothetical protein